MLMIRVADQFPKKSTDAKWHINYDWMLYELLVFLNFKSDMGNNLR